MLLFAQDDAGAMTQSWFSALTQINLWGFVAVCVICGAATDIVRRVLQHRERIAMIQAGMNPNECSAASGE